MDQFEARRDAMLADRAALLEKLKSATAEEKKALLEKMRTQYEAVLEEQRALSKQFRNEMRRLRQSSPGSGGR